jgi:polysaccharide pyruvyl transferase CsaB
LYDNGGKSILPKKETPSFRAVVSGYFGFNNIGDEAILYSMLTLWRKFFPEGEFTVLSSNPAKTKSLYQVEAANRWRLKEIKQAISGSDLLVSGGGSLLQDVTGLKSLLYYLGVIRLAKYLKKPVFFYAQGIGPVQRVTGRYLVRRVVNQVDLITVRDEESAQALKGMGVDRPEIYVTADPVLGLTSEALKLNEELNFALVKELFDKYHLEQSKPTAGFCLRSWPDLKEAQERVFVQAGEVLRGEGWQVVFLPFHYPADLPLAQKLAQSFTPSAAVIKEELTVPQLMAIMSKLKLVVGMRLHALIIAAVMGVPFVGIAYDPKITRFLNHFNLTPAGTPKDLTFEALEKKIEDILAEPAAFQQKITLTLPMLQQKARESALIMENIIR